VTLRAAGGGAAGTAADRVVVVTGGTAAGRAAGTGRVDRDGGTADGTGRVDRDGDAPEDERAADPDAAGRLEDPKGSARVADSGPERVGELEGEDRVEDPDAERADLVERAADSVAARSADPSTERMAEPSAERVVDSSNAGRLADLAAFALPAMTKGKGCLTWTALRGLGAARLAVAFVVPAPIRPRGFAAGAFAAARRVAGSFLVAVAFGVRGRFAGAVPRFVVFFLLVAMKLWL